ncbi:hypothetical protein KBD08_02705 [Candidatus Babeliales bacterium]|nr:hypothetical protein [Candidatus Babeliales bacterium]
MKKLQLLICFLLSSSLSMASDNNGGEIVQPMYQRSAVSYPQYDNQKAMWEAWESYVQYENRIEDQKCKDTCLVLCILGACAGAGIYSGMPNRNAVGLYPQKEQNSKKMN